MVEQHLLLNEIVSLFLNAELDWIKIDRGDYPYHGISYDWNNLVEDRKSVFIKTSDDNELKIDFKNYKIIDRESNANLQWNDNDSRWELTLPVKSGNHFQLLELGNLRKAINSDSPIIMYSNLNRTNYNFSKNSPHTEVKFTGTPVLLYSDAEIARYSVELIDEEHWKGAKQHLDYVPVELRLHDVDLADEFNSLLLSPGDGISFDVSHHPVFYLKGSKNIHFIQSK